MYRAPDGSQKGPIVGQTMSRMLERRLGGVTAATLAWAQGMAAWQPLGAVPAFQGSLKLAAAAWYYGDGCGGQRGPVGSSTLLRSLQDGTLPPDSLVCSAALTSNQWKRAQEVKELQPTLQQRAAAAATVPSGSGNDNGYGQAATSSTNTSTSAASAPEAAFEPSFPASASASASADANGSAKAQEQEQTQARAQVQALVQPRPATLTYTDEQPGNDVYTSRSVRVEGLPRDGSLRLQEVLAFFSKAGLIALRPDQSPHVHLHTEGDNDSGDSSGRHSPIHTHAGVATIRYHVPASVELALQVLSGAYFRADALEQVVTVTRTADVLDADEATAAAVSAMSKKRRRNADPEARLAIAKQTTARKVSQDKLGWADDEGDSGSGFNKKLHTIVLENMFTPADLVPSAQEREAAAEAALADRDADFEARSAYELALEADIVTECLKAGEIENLILFSHNPRGIVVVKFATQRAAQDTVSRLHGRLFAGRPTRCYFYDGKTDFSVGAAEAAETADSSNGSSSCASASSVVRGGLQLDGPHAKKKRTGEDGFTSSQAAAAAAAAGGETEAEAVCLDAFGNWLDTQELPEELRVRTQSAAANPR